MQLAEVLQQGVSETIEGYLTGNPQNAILGIAEMPSGEVFYEDKIILRYMLQYLYESEFWLNPAQVVGEYGGELRGWQAWDFMFKRYHVNPRTEVTGLRLDGRPAEIYLKELDMAAEVRVYAYASLDATLPLAHITQIVADASQNLPERLLTYRPSAKI